MPATAAIAAVGSKIEVDTTGAGAWALVGEVVNIGGPEVDVNPIKASNLQSPNQAHEYIPGMGEGGTVKLDINFTRAMMTQMYAYYRTAKNWRITLSDATTVCTFTAFWSKYGNEEQLEGAQMTPIELKVTGKPVWT